MYFPGQFAHLLEGGRDNLGARESRNNGPKQAGQAPLLGTDTLSCLPPLSTMAPWVLPPQSWETELNNLHFLPLWVTGFQCKGEMGVSDWWKLGHTANPELQRRLGKQGASTLNMKEGNRFFLKVLGASSSTERTFACHVGQMSDRCLLQKCTPESQLGLPNSGHGG